MLSVYGALMPLRVLEEIRFWKMQEREHTVVIRALVPDLEPEYAEWLERWEGVFARTEAASQQWIETALRTHGPLSPHACRCIEELLARSKAESQEFICQLFLLQERSKPVRDNPVVHTVILHIIRESEYFLGVLQLVTGVGHWVPMRQEADPSRPSAATASETASPPPKPPKVGASESALRSAAEPEARPESGFEGSHESGPGKKQTFIHLIGREDGRDLTATQEGTWSAGANEAPAAPGALKPVPIGGHTLPPLPYSYEALEPYIDAETMRLHHDKHHLSYVEGLNKAEKALEQARRSGNFDLVKHWERELAFNGAGHYLHTVFWNVMKPKGGGKPTGPIAQEINKTFGSFDAFKKHFSAAAEKVEGGGWAILVWSPRSHRVEILQAEKHQNLSQWDVIPLLVLDVWEHSYYLKYKNERPKYIEAWWTVVNWDHVNERYSAARMLRWLPY